jgi:hypothetical protein
MAARTTRREARERVIKSFLASLDTIIPEDEAVPLRGSTFLDWEDQADGLRRAVVPTLLQERVALDDGAEVEAGGAGRCPHCSSDRVYVDEREGRGGQREVISPHGPVVVYTQQCRCRACGGSFSPSAP